MTSARPPSTDRQFAKAVARQLDRRRTWRRLLLWLLLAAAVVLASLYATCGSGFGLGGKGKGKGKGGGATATSDRGPRRCAVRIGGKGITVDGKAATIAQAVAACRGSSGADVIVTGAARQGDWDALKAALEAAKVEVYVREPEPTGGSAPAPGREPARPAPDPASPGGAAPASGG